MSYEDYVVHRRSIGSLFEQLFSYRIPPYQRSYSWNVDNARRLFEDIINTSDEPSGAPGSTNLLGAMVVVNEGNSSPEFEVVDGQQRLATTALMLCAMRSYLYKFEGSELPGTGPALENALNTIDDILNKDGEPRIKLGKDDEDLFRDILATNTNDYETRCRDLMSKYKNGKKRILSSNELLINNYRVLSELVEKHMSTFGLDDAFYSNDSDGFLRASNKLVKYITQSMVKRNHFAFITVQNRHRAYKIFATFNSTGQQLLNADLIKSHILGKTESGTGNGRMERKWRKIFDERLEDHDKFLYESTASRHPSGKCNNIPITIDNLYAIVESMVKNSQDAEEYVEQLEEDAKIVKQMDHPDDLPDDDKYEKTHSIFYRMQLLHTRYIRVPMLAAGRKWNSLDSDEFQTLADCLLTFFFKFKFINDGTAEDVRSITNVVTQKIEKGASLSEMISLILMNESVSGSPRPRIDETKFPDNFKEKMFQPTPKAAKYVLLSMEIHLNRNKPHPSPRHRFELEHILPKNHQKWNVSSFLGESPLDDDIDKYKNRLGNLTLLSMKWNRGMGAKCFEEKLKDPKGYESSSIELNAKYLTRYSNWTADTLEEREKDLCDLAIETWSLSQYNKHLRKQGYQDLK